MRCSDFEVLWFERSEGRLSSSGLAALDAHLQTCVDCSHLARQLDRLEVGLEVLGDDRVEAPGHLTARILARLDGAGPGFVGALLRCFTSRRVLAASVASLAFFAGFLAREVYRLNEWVRAEPVQTVVLEYRSSDAREVRLVGDFNAWGGEPGRVRGERVDGRWVFRVELDPGRYQYAFETDGKNWLPDPNAVSKLPDGFGGTNSVLYVPGREPPPARTL